MTMSGCQALEEWCRQVVAASGVSLANMSSAWSDGKAFCALIHSHRPDLIDWDTVKTNNAYQNCQLAFQTAEDRLGITSLLDVCDVARGPRDVSRGPSRRVSPGSPPDRLSILTYVAQFYHKFHHLTDPRHQQPGLGAPDTAAAEDGHRRGGVHSVLSSRRSRSVSASPPLEKENPFRRELLENISSKAERSPCKKLVNKFHKQKSAAGDPQLQAPAPVRLRHQNTEADGAKKTRRLVQSMFVEPLPDKRLADMKSGSEGDDDRGGTTGRGRKGILNTPKPYRVSQEQQSVSILSKTQHYLQEKRKRSQSQGPGTRSQGPPAPGPPGPPGLGKKEKRKFDFLSTANFNNFHPAAAAVSAAVTAPTKAGNKEAAAEAGLKIKEVSASALKLKPQKKLPNENEAAALSAARREEKKNMKAPQFCNFQKFEFALQSHRRFVQTLV